MKYNYYSQLIYFFFKVFYIAERDKLPPCVNRRCFCYFGAIRQISRLFPLILFMYGGEILLLKLEDLLSRADEGILQEILGVNTVKLLTKLNQAYVYNKNLKKIICDFYGLQEMLLDRNIRNKIFDLLRENEAKTLGHILGMKDTNGIYEKLKDRKFRRGSKDEENLFRFFNLLPPPVVAKVEYSNIESTNIQYGLFDHQRRAVRKVKKLLNSEPYRVLLHMPTGSGKTRTAMNVICEHFRENEPTVVVWLAASEELCEQALDEFKKAWGFLGNRTLSLHRFWGSHSIDISCINDGFIVAGLQKLFNTIKRAGGIDLITRLGNKTSLVVMDEAHQAIAPSYKIILDTLFYVGKVNRLLGLSATPGRTWNNPQADSELAEFFAKRKVKLEVDNYSNPVNYLIDQGYLARVKYRQLFYGNGNISKKDLDAIKEMLDIPINVLKVLGEDEQRNLKIIHEVELLLKKHKRIIVFAPSVESANMLAFVLKIRGHIAYSLTGDTPFIRRREIIEDYKNSDSQHKVLCNFGVLTTGFDAPQTSAAVIARPTLSLVLYSQMIGRAIRGVKAGGNEEAEVVTIIDNGLPGFRTVAESFENWEDVWDE